MSKISLTIEADGESEFARLVQGLVSPFAVPANPAPLAETAAPQPEAGKKPTRKKPETAPEVTETKTEAAPVEASVEVPPIDDVRAALKALGTAKGEDPVFELLGRFKARNASTVAEGDRAAVITEAKQLAEAE